MNKPDEWGTPPALVKLLDKEFRFTLDVCATHENTKLQRFYGPVGSMLKHPLCHSGPLCVAEDGLAQSWKGEIGFMNPPYSAGNIPRWVQKAAMEAQLGAIVVGLVRADTSTSWWRRWIADEAKEIRFTKRITFVGAPGAYNFPTAIVVWDRRDCQRAPRYSYMDLPAEALGRKGNKVANED